MRRKYSTPIWINTPLELYRVLNTFSPDTKLKMVCRDYSRCNLRTVEGTIHLQMKESFPLYQLIKANRPYASAKDLLATLGKNMIKVRYSDRSYARKFVGNDSIGIVDYIFSTLKGKEIDTVLHYYAIDGEIVKSECSFIVTGTALPPMMIPHLTDNRALLYLKRSYLQEQLDINPNLRIDYHTTVDAVLEELQEAFGSDLYMKIHALQEVVMS
jgi:predicted regulator of amino acid metabolism with ACT domain